MSNNLYDRLRPICETDNIWVEFFPSIRYSKSDSSCLCSHAITECCEIIHIKTGQVFVVGNDCIEYFGITPLCSKCNIYYASSSTALQCNECHKGKKGKSPTGLVLLKKYYKKSYEYVYSHDMKYCEWVRDNMDPKYDKHFCAWLKLQSKLEYFNDLRSFNK